MPVTADQAGSKEAQVKRRPVLYVIASGAAPARELPTLISTLTDEWDTCVITTPDGSRFFDVSRVAKLTGHPVRSSFKDPDAPDVLPPADAFAAAPATFNTVNKWAAGISDTLALGLLNEATGLGLPIVTAPWPNAALARHPAFGRSISTLRGCGVRVILDLEELPDDDNPGHAEFPWDELRAELARMRTAVMAAGQSPA
jgi:phosphopantothenoylcysteine synthetase/decarboxylase